MYSIHEAVVEILSVLIEFFKRADRAAVFCAEAELFHSIPCWLLCEMVRQVRIVHRHVIVRHGVAVGIRKVEGRVRRVTTQPEATDLEYNLSVRATAAVSRAIDINCNT